MFIRTERLFLRPGWIEDAPELTRAIAHERVVRMLARAPWPYREPDAHAFLKRPQAPRLPSLLVTLPAESGRIIGGCGMRRSESAEGQVGYWITPEFWGNGYAREALAALLRVAPLLGHRRIAARHALDNPAAGSVLRANGFRPIGGAARYHSLGRANDVASVEYALQLEPVEDRSRPDWTRAMAYGVDAGLGAAA